MKRRGRVRLTTSARLVLLCSCAVLWLALAGCAAKGAVKQTADSAADTLAPDLQTPDNETPDLFVPPDIVDTTEHDADATQLPPDGEILDQLVEDTTPPLLTVKALQNPTEPRNCNENANEQPLVFGSVTLEGVIVTAPVHPINSTLVRFYVADQDGGLYSGIAVVADQSELTALFPGGGPNIGDVLTISGELQEFYCFTRIKLTANGVKRTAEKQPLPSPIVISTCAQMADESLEGVVVTLQGVKVVNNALDRGEVLIEDSTNTSCVIDDDFQFWTNGPVGGAQSDPKKPGVAHTEYVSITGVVHYTFGAFKLEPRSTDDLVPTQTPPTDTEQPDTAGDSEPIDVTPDSTPDSAVDDTADTTVDGDNTVSSDTEPDTTSAPEPVVCINELHYNNLSTDVDEGIELMGPAGMSLTNWKVVLYNGATGKLYDTKIFSSSDTFDKNVVEGLGFLWISYPTNGIQNGDPDGLALVDDKGEVVTFISWGGKFTAVDGPAAGKQSIDILVKEGDNTPTGLSLQKIGTGRKCSDFSWSGPTASSVGTINTGQTISPAPESDASDPDADSNNGDDADSQDDLDDGSTND